MSDPLVGTRFAGRFDIEKPLAAGGMGAVYVAVQQPTGRKVALKVIKDKGASDPTLVARFQREADALASVSHPNIVTMFDSGVDDGVFFIVMELLNGLSLRKELEANKQMPWPRAARVMSHVLRALSAVHAAGIVHRDLKPDNIFLTSSKGHVDFAKLLDFGIVRAAQTGAGPDTPTETQNLTGTGGVIGTPGYLAPEQLRGEPTTSRSDLYAVGVILYEMVTGVFPFTAPTVQAMAIKQLIDPVPPPSSLAPSLPPEAERLIVALMDRDPQRRPKDADDVLAALEGAALAPSTGPVPVATAATTAVPVPTVGQVQLETLPPQRPTLSTGGFVARVAAVGVALFAVTCGVAGVIDVVGKNERRASEAERDRIALTMKLPEPTTPPTVTPTPTTPTPPVTTPEPEPKTPEPKMPVPKVPQPPVRGTTEPPEGPRRTTSIPVLPPKPLEPTPEPTPTPTPTPNTEPAPGTTTAKETLSPVQVSAPLRAAKAQLKECYVGESYFRADGVIQPDGTLGPELKITRVTGAEHHHGCLEGVLRSLKWPAFNGDPKKVNLPLTSVAW